VLVAAGCGVAAGELEGGGVVYVEVGGVEVGGVDYLEADEGGDGFLDCVVAGAVVVATVGLLDVGDEERVVGEDLVLVGVGEAVLVFEPVEGGYWRVGVDLAVDENRVGVLGDVVWRGEGTYLWAVCKYKKKLLTRLFCIKLSNDLKIGNILKADFHLFR